MKKRTTTLKSTSLDKSNLSKHLNEASKANGKRIKKIWHKQSTKKFIDVINRTDESDLYKREKIKVIKTIDRKKIANISNT